MFCHWLFPADLEYALEVGNMIIMDVGYPMITKSSSEVVISSVASLWARVLSELEPALQTICRHFTVA